MQPASSNHNPASSCLPSRRDAIRVASVVVSGAISGVDCGLLIGATDRPRNDKWQFFTPEEARLVEALSEQIIPKDKDPGGKDAGVVYFIDRQLVGPYARFKTVYRDGLRNLQAMCRKQYDKPFEALAWNDQTKVLAAAESGSAAKELWRSPSSGEFFNHVLDRIHLQGFYGSPRHASLIATTSATRYSGLDTATTFDQAVI